MLRFNRLYASVKVDFKQTLLINLQITEAAKELPEL